jgi:hypothetical protein
MKFQIVISRYNEDIYYLNKFFEYIIVYNKGNDDIYQNFNVIKLPNIGRESHTYLYHIVNNYDNLASQTLFIQGKIDDHDILPFIEYFKNKDFIGKLNNQNINFIKNKIKHVGKYLTQVQSGDLKISKYNPFEWINKIGLNINDYNDFNMVWGANFSVSKNIILKKPKIFYQNLLRYVEYDINPEEGHFFERSWYIIFNHPTYIPKKKILYYNGILNNNILSKFNQILNNNNNISFIHIWNNFNFILPIHFININYYILINNPLKNIIINTINKYGILLNFDDKLFEIIIQNNNISFYDLNNDYQNFILNNFNNDISLNYMKISLKYVEGILFFYNFDKVLFTHSLNINSNLKYFKINSFNNDLFINYDKSSNISLFFGNNLKIFYKDNFEDFYIDDIDNFIN